MAGARINLKNIDYFKFKKLVIDANRDDYNQCSKEVKSLCDDVQTLKFHDEEFDDETDRNRFNQICSSYKQILASKRIDPTDVRIKSGWWGDQKNSYSAGKLKPAILKEYLLSKARDWAQRNGDTENYCDSLATKIEGPGLYVFKHKDHQCFQYVGRADKMFARCGETLKAAYEGSSTDPLAALLIISKESDWEFYICPTSTDDDERSLRILENDLILKHDSIWPHGLNFRLHIDSLLEVSEFRKSCLRHNWPPISADAVGQLDMAKLRRSLATSPAAEPSPPAITSRPSTPSLPSTPSKTKKPQAKRPAWVGVKNTNEENKENNGDVDDEDKMMFIPIDSKGSKSPPGSERRMSVESVSSTATFTMDTPPDDLKTSEKSKSTRIIRQGSYTIISPTKSGEELRDVDADSLDGNVPCASPRPSPRVDRRSRTGSVSSLAGDSASKASPRHAVRKTSSRPTSAELSKTRAPRQVTGSPKKSVAKKSPTVRSPVSTSAGGRLIGDRSGTYTDLSVGSDGESLTHSVDESAAVMSSSTDTMDS